MACFVPICVLIERVMPDGSESILLAPDLSTALADAAKARDTGAWTTRRLVLGREDVLEGDALARAIAEVRAVPA